MKNINKLVDTLLRFVMACSSLILFVVTFLQVVFRFLFKSPLPWSQDVIRLCFTYLVFFGAAYCVKEKEHLNIDVLLISIKPKARKTLELVTDVVLLAFFVFLGYFGMIFALSGRTQLAPYLPIPMVIYYMSVPLCALFMIFYLSQQFAVRLKNYNIDEQKGENAV